MNNDIKVTSSKPSYNNKATQSCTSEPGFLFKSHTITVGNNPSPQAILEINIGGYLCNKDDFGCITQRLNGKNLKNVRLVCKNIDEMCDINRTLLVKLYPIDLKTEGVKSNSDKLSFIVKNNLKCILFLDQSTIHSFYELIISSETNKPDFTQKIQRIESLTVSNLDIEGIIIFKKILKKINEDPNLFANLKNLKTTQFSNFTDCSIPNSIESFESFDDNQIGPYDNYKASTNVNICNLKNLKSITLGIILENNTFNLQNLPNLESINIRCLYSNPHRRALEIQLKNHPKLVSVSVNGEEEMLSRPIAITPSGPDAKDNQWITQKAIPTKISLQGITRHFYNNRCGLGF